MRYALLLVALSSVALTGIEIEIPFPDLVKQADSIFLARVVTVRSQWQGASTSKSLVTDVEFAIERVYKGKSASQRTLRFAGGTTGDVSQKVEGVPTFAVGDR